MPHVKLTAKQEVFCQGIANGLDQAGAYRAAYDAEGMKNSTIYPHASKLMKNDKVAARIAELKAEVQKKHLWTREMSVKALVQAYKEGRPSEKVAAIKELNAMHGYREPQEISLQGNLDVIQRRIVDDVSDD